MKGVSPLSCQNPLVKLGGGTMYPKRKSSMLDFDLDELNLYNEETLSRKVEDDEIDAKDEAVIKGYMEA